EKTGHDNSQLAQAFRRLPDHLHHHDMGRPGVAGVASDRKTARAGAGSGLYHRGHRRDITPQALARMDGSRLVLGGSALTGYNRSHAKQTPSLEVSCSA